MMKSIVVICLFTLCGCAATVDRMAGAAGDSAARAAVPAAAQSLDELTKPENQKRLTELAQSPAVEQLSVDLGHGVGRGFLDEVIAYLVQISPAVKRTIEQSSVDALPEGTRSTIRLVSQCVAEGATQGVMNSLVNQNPVVVRHFIADELITPVTLALDRQVNQSIDAALNDNNQTKLEDLTRRMMQQIVPPVRQLLSDSAVDAIKLSARPDVQPAVSSNARVMSEGATAGPRDALIQLGVLNENGHITTAVRVAIGAACAVGLMLLVTLVIAVVALWRLAFGARTARRD